MCDISERCLYVLWIFSNVCSVRFRSPKVTSQYALFPLQWISEFII